MDGEPAALTYREYELLRFLVLREGRLRAKLGAYGEVVRTVRGGGYRFDRHADVVIRYGEAQSPDRF